MLEILAWPEIGQRDGTVRLRRVFRPGMGFRFPHVHLLLDEAYYVEYGVADFWIGHRSMRLAQGQQFHTPRFEAHLGPLNRSMTDLVFVQTIEAARIGPVQRYVTTLGRYLDEGRDLHGDLPPIAAAAVFAGQDQEAFLPGLSPALQQKVLFPLARGFEDWRAQRRRARAQALESRVDNAWDDW
jgi:hypothetical protein